MKERKQEELVMPGFHKPGMGGGGEHRRSLTSKLLTLGRVNQEGRGYSFSEAVSACPQPPRPFGSNYTRNQR